MLALFFDKILPSPGMFNLVNNNDLIEYCCSKEMKSRIIKRF
jgi:hypothetical protein